MMKFEPAVPRVVAMLVCSCALVGSNVQAQVDSEALLQVVVCPLSSSARSSFNRDRRKGKRDSMSRVQENSDLRWR